MEKKEKTMKKIVKNSKPKTVKFPTLLEAIEKVVELAEDSKLNDRLFVEAAPVSVSLPCRRCCSASACIKDRAGLTLTTWQIILI